MLAALSGQRFGFFVLGGRQYDVIGQLTRDLRSRPDDLGNLMVRTANGERRTAAHGAARQSDRADRIERAARALRHNRYAAATVSGTLAPSVSLDQGIAAFDAVAAATLDERFSTTLTGAARDFAESSSSLTAVLALALLLIYLVLAASSRASATRS